MMNEDTLIRHSEKFTVTCVVQWSGDRGRVKFVHWNGDRTELDRLVKALNKVMA